MGFQDLAGDPHGPAPHRQGADLRAVPEGRGEILAATDMTRPGALSGPLGGHLAMLAFSGLVAGSFALGGRIANEVDPAAFNAMRFTLSTGVVAGIVLVRGGVAKGTFRAPWRYLVLGGLYAAYFVAMFEGLKTAPPVSSAAVFTLTPVMSAVFGWFMLRQVTTPRIALALAIGAAGALWVIFRADIDALIAFEIGRGEAIFFLGCIAHAAYTPAVRLLNRGEPILGFTLGTLTAATLILMVWGAPGLVSFDFAGARPLVWVTMFYTAFMATSVTVLLLQFAAMRLPSSKVMAYTYLVPSWVALWMIALGDGVPPVLILAGVALTVVALVLLLKDEPAHRPAAAPGHAGR
ncbi:EamA family transporter [Rhodobacterales bacterium HKCCE2091]|nr:EamA family transporter [Rhodobacterales bacterium HKCCE2091]